MNDNKRNNFNYLGGGGDEESEIIFINEVDGDDFENKNK